jgi:hypothetical protein
MIAIIAYLQWRRDFELTSRQLQEGVTAELIRQRIKPYTELMRRLRIASAVLDRVQALDEEKAATLLDTLQDAIYGPVGLLATHETRQLILFAREGCLCYQEGLLTHKLLMFRLWSIHLSLRSDLGIVQPQWDTAVDKIQHRTNPDEQVIWQELPELYPWEVMQSLHPLKEEKGSQYDE